MTRFAIAAFTFGPSEDNTISLLIGRPLSTGASNIQDTTKYRKVQDRWDHCALLQPGRWQQISIAAGSVMFRAEVRGSHRFVYIMLFCNMLYAAVYARCMEFDNSPSNVV